MKRIVNMKRIADETFYDVDDFGNVIEWVGGVAAYYETKDGIRIAVERFKYDYAWSYFKDIIKVATEAFVDDNDDEVEVGENYVELEDGRKVYIDHKTTFEAIFPDAEIEEVTEEDEYCRAHGWD